MCVGLIQSVEDHKRTKTDLSQARGNSASRLPLDSNCGSSLSLACQTTLDSPHLQNFTTQFLNISPSPTNQSIPLSFSLSIHIWKTLTNTVAIIIFVITIIIMLLNQIHWTSSNFNYKGDGKKSVMSSNVFKSKKNGIILSKTRPLSVPKQFT